MTDKIQLYSLATPNGQKASIALEELGLPCDPHVIDISEGDQFTEEFIKINPNSKIPAIVDPNGPNGKPINIMESGAILLYLSEKTGKLLPKDGALRMQTIQWLFFQVGGVGPMFGQFGHFYRYAKDKCDHPYPVERYSTEAKRLLTVIEKQLERSEYLACDEYTIADIATFPWVVCLDKFYEASDFLEMQNFHKVNAWLNRCLERKAVQVGMKVCDITD